MTALKRNDSQAWAALAIVVGIVIVIFALLEFPFDHIASTKTQATVSKMTTSRDQDVGTGEWTTAYYPTVRFQVGGAWKDVLAERTLEEGKFRVGDQVTLRYSRGNPNSVRVGPVWKWVAAPGAAAVAGAALVGFGLMRVNRKSPAADRNAENVEWLDSVYDGRKIRISREASPQSRAVFSVLGIVAFSVAFLSLKNDRIGFVVLGLIALCLVYFALRRRFTIIDPGRGTVEEHTGLVSASKRKQWPLGTFRVQIRDEIHRSEGSHESTISYNVELVDQADTTILISVESERAQAKWRASKIAGLIGLAGVGTSSLCPPENAA